MIKVAITGGIGSGKSTVCNLVEMMGHKVYYADSRGAVVVDSDPDIQREICELLGSEAYLGGKLNRGFVASKIFTSPDLLSKINQITHPRIIADFIDWCNKQEQAGERVVFLECAILFESGMHNLVDRIVAICAPKEVRVARCVERDGISAEQVEQRINNQINDKERSSRSHYTLISDDRTLVIPQVIGVIEQIKKLL